MTQRSLQHDGRIAGALYLALVITAPFGLLYVPTQLIEPGHATPSIEYLAGLEGVLRLGIASDLVHQVIVVFLVFALYRLFASVSEALAKQVVVFGALLSVPIMFVNVLNHVAVIAIANGVTFQSAFDKPQREALAALFIHLHAQGIFVVSVFWGLWLFPLGVLIIRSGFIPRIFGFLLIAAGIGYLVDAFTQLLLPAYAPLVQRVCAPLQFGELPIVFYLLIRGARTPQRMGQVTNANS